jgi:hypothetical protein
MATTSTHSVNSGQFISIQKKFLTYSRGSTYPNCPATDKEETKAFILLLTLQSSMLQAVVPERPKIHRPSGEPELWLAETLQPACLFCPVP